jgi:hypothetical protein
MIAKREASLTSDGRPVLEPEPGLPGDPPRRHALPGVRVLQRPHRPRLPDLYPFPPLHDALAGFTWLTFLVSPHAQIPYTAAGLLDWAGMSQQVYDSPHLPDPMHSALEVPWSLWLSPGKGSWHHAAAPVTSGGRTELWHTRLGLGAFEPPMNSAPSCRTALYAASPADLSRYTVHRRNSSPVKASAGLGCCALAQPPALWVFLRPKAALPWR